MMRVGDSQEPSPEPQGNNKCKTPDMKDAFRRLRGYLKHSRVIGDVDAYLRDSRRR